jgi:large subunit ribosomal protein L6
MPSPSRKAWTWRSTDEQITVKGAAAPCRAPRSTLVTVTTKDGVELTFAPANESREANAMSGTMRALVEQHGQRREQGLREEADAGRRGLIVPRPRANKLNLQIGFSHPVVKEMPEGVKVETPTQTEIVIKGADRQVVGQVAAEMRAFRPPEPYKGKGIRYADERWSSKKPRRSKEQDRHHDEQERAASAPCPPDAVRIAELRVARL